ncbi:hypothetical protein SBRY_40700 [Actinacidiphila bryophytorum]|uniref:Uncharacterized protein n=1 Tax=Actinacidiphila bryophytorum TaxID=1436133 RepID=A0A9W4MIM5_9ACTN|nr:hypothetical protein SBRY_40700 [Actinacidiphila bryophytorum]
MRQALLRDVLVRRESSAAYGPGPRVRRGRARHPEPRPAVGHLCTDFLGHCPGRPAGGRPSRPPAGARPGRQSHPGGLTTGGLGSTLWQRCHSFREAPAGTLAVRYGNVVIRGRRHHP